VILPLPISFMGEVWVILSLLLFKGCEYVILPSPYYRRRGYLPVKGREVSPY